MRERVAILGVALLSFSLCLSPVFAQTTGHAPAPAIKPPANPKPALPNDLKDLPLVEIHATSRHRAMLAIILSGDGGWVDIDKKIGEELSVQGIDIIGVDSRAYLAKGRSPDEVARDMIKVARTYLRAWHDSTLLFIGYSRGADLGPFIASRLPADLKSRTVLVALLGLSTTANFKFHVIDLVRDVSRATDVPVAPELAKLKGMRVLCVYGIQEKVSGCRGADSAHVKIVAKKGGHHFDKNYQALATLILGELSP